MKISMLSLDDTVDVLSWCLEETEGTMPLRNDTLEMYPELSNTTDIKSSIKDRYDKFYKDNEHLVEEYSDIWNKYDAKIKSFFEELFKVKLDKEITAYIANIPVCPRNIEDLSFIFIPESEDFFIETTIHEICHFYFFEVCKKIIPNWSYDMFDKPNILWYISEIMIDPLLNNSKLQEIYNHTFKCYDIFYNTYINNKNIVSILNDIYSNHSLEESILLSYNLLQDNKEVFLKQVQ